MNSCETNRVEAEAAKPERDAQGRFVAGNKGGTGNPFGRHVAGLRAALLAAITDTDMQAVAHKLIAMATAGDLAAMKLLLQYTIGKPAPAPNPDHVEIDEWQYFMKSLEPETVLNIGRELRPILAEQQVNRIREAFDNNDPTILDGKRKESPSRTGEEPTTNGDFAGGDAGGPPSPDGTNGAELATAAAPGPLT